MSIRCRLIWHLLVGLEYYIKTSRHQNSREGGRKQKNKTCYFLISRISSRQATGFEKKKILNIQELTSGYSTVHRYLLTPQYSPICLVWFDCINARVLFACWFVLLSGSLDIRVHWGAATTLIVCGDVTIRYYNVTS